MLGWCTIGMWIKVLQSIGDMVLVDVHDGPDDEDMRVCIFMGEMSPGIYAYLPIEEDEQRTNMVIYGNPWQCSTREPRQIISRISESLG